MADVVKQHKDDFYDKYNYLKPECEKDWIEKTKDWVVTAGEWCKEHWKTILKIVVVVILVAVSIVLLCTGVGGILAGIAWGAILGAVIGGVSGGIASGINGGSFFEGAVNGAFTGTLGGAIGGGITSGITAFLGPASTLLRSIVQSASIGALSGSISNVSVTSISLLIEYGTLEGYGSAILASGISGVLVGGILGGASEGLKNIRSFKLLSGKAKNTDVSTNTNESVFYSGRNSAGIRNADLAKEFAKQNGKKTIEMTAGGKYIDDLRLYDSYKNARITPRQADKIWGILSDRYSKSATGNIFEFTNGSLPRSVYKTIELPNINAGINSGRITNIFFELLKSGG